MNPRLFFILCLVIFCACNNDTLLFRKIEPEHSGISFNNVVLENDSINPIDLEFLYNGGGVAAGDFNNDGLTDLYFTASTVSNKLYLNKGDLRFDDITTKAGVTGEGMWCNSASVVDINSDGLNDIYVCTTIKTNPGERKNLLYINQGIEEGNTPVFKEMAQSYGLDDTSYSVHSAFFDYDNDGDLDMYLVTTKLARRNSTNFTNYIKDSSTADMDRLFRNDWNDSLKHPVFTDVSKTAGIKEQGFGLGVAIADINKDGWKDIYVTNDFFGSDNLYINNKNGIFADKAKEYFKHTSQNAMGNDIADINNDGWADIIAVDMNPEDNYRKKKNMNGNNYYIYQSMLYENIMLQYVRNTLQLNMGPRVNGNDSIGDPVFADISFYTNTAETDWSWNSSIADFDNDGNRDIIITNGYPRDVTDHDFISFRSKAANLASKQQIIDEMPIIKVPNYAFKNDGNLKFENTTEKWGMQQPSFSNGAVAVDLDNDGDLDYVINNINEEAFVYENTANPKGKTKANYISLEFKGDRHNTKGLGVYTELYSNGRQQVYENFPYRGYLSCVDSKAHFGLDTVSVIDSIVIRWPGNKKQVLKNVQANQLLKIDISNANIPDTWDLQVVASTAMFTDITNTAGTPYTSRERDYIDFDKERLLPHKLSQYGPGLAAADVDGNGLDDIYIGGSAEQPGSFLLQQADGTFILQSLPDQAFDKGRRPENMGVLLFDADNDGDNDLWCANGSNEFAANTSAYADRFYVNDGKANFRLDTTVLPVNYTSKSCIKAADFDSDGDLDLFIGGRSLPGKYPMPVNSFIYRNDSKNAVVKFTDVTATVCKDLQNTGMVCDGVWTDFDNDGTTDLIITGEWMPVTFFKNNKGQFENITAQTGIASQTGWWNSITAGDFDNDGDIDYVAGNLGQNAFLRASEAYPVKVYAKDFDNNGNTDAVVTVFLKDQQGEKREFPALNRDDIVSQVPALKKKFLTYKEFAVAEIHQIFTEEQLKDALVLQANNFSSCYIQNNGNGKFELKTLPPLAQMAPLNGIVTDDFNNDGNLDIAVCGNDYGNEVTAGRYDAMNGLLMLGDGKGNFAPQTILQSGLYVPGDAKALVKLRSSNGKLLIAASQNKDKLKLFQLKQKLQYIAVGPFDVSAVVTYKNGNKQKREFYYGTSFLSQSARFINVDSTVSSVVIKDAKGNTRQAVL